MGKKGKDNKKGKHVDKTPAGMQGKHTRTKDGEPVCYSFNLSACPHAMSGKRCDRGWHVCGKCLGPHSMQECPH